MVQLFPSQSSLHPLDFTHHKTALQKHPNGKINLFWPSLSVLHAINTQNHLRDLQRAVAGRRMKLESHRRFYSKSWSMRVWVIDSMIRLAISFIKVIVMIMAFASTHRSPATLFLSLRELSRLEIMRAPLGVYNY